MKNNFKKSLFLLAFSTALGGVPASVRAEYSQTMNSLAGQDISYDDGAGGTKNVQDSHGNNLQYHSSAYTVTKVRETDEYDFKIYKGLNANNEPVFEYYTYSLNGSSIAPNSIKNVQKIEEPEGGVCNATNSCIRVAKGVGEDGYSTYEYYSYELRDDGEEYASSEKVKSPIGGNVEDLRFVGGSDTQGSFGMGSAIEVHSEHIDLIDADFINNNANSYYNYGGAINVGGENGDGASLGDVVGDFIGNQAGNDYGYWARGGAIYFAKNQTADSITGNFIGNRASQVGGCYGLGGALRIYYSGDIKSVIGDFIGNWAGSIGWSQDGASIGGAIYSYATDIETITGDFINNYVHEAYRGAYGGAVYFGGGELTNLTGNFINNRVTSDNATAAASALYAENAKITNLTGDFINNYSESIEKNVIAGSVVTDKEITTMVSNFIGNHAKSTNGYAQASALYNEGKIETLRGSFIENYSESVNGRADAGALYNYGTIDTIVGDFVGNYTEGKTGAYGGAIINEHYNDDYPAIINTLSGVFINNHTKADDDVQGGAIWNSGTMHIIADGNGTNGYVKSVVFKDNYVEDALGKRFEAVYNAADANLTFTANNDASYVFYDYINGDDGGNITFNGDGSGKINLYNDIKGQKDINFTAAYILNMLSSGDIHKGTAKASVISAKNITISSAIQMAVDVDLENEIMDHFAADNFSILGTGSIDVNRIVIVSDAASEIGETTIIPFVALNKDAEGNPIGTATGLDKISTDITEAKSDAYVYTVSYNPSTGDFEFTKTGKVAPVGPTPEEAGGMEAAASVAMAQSSVEAVASQALNRDLTMTIGFGSGDVQHLSTWAQAFGTKDAVEMKHVSNKVDTQFFGIIGGIDSKLFAYRNGLSAVYGIYGAYVGGIQKHDGNKTNVRGGYVGVSVAFRRSVVFSNTIVNGGYLHNEANSDYGKDKFATKVVSVSNKTGVDIKKKDTTITPTLSLNYMGINTDDYTTKAGTRIQSHFINAFTVAPGLKVSQNFCQGLEGYAKVSYKMFFYDNGKVKANDIILPSMSIKPYVEYGVGLKKDWSKDEWDPYDASTYAEITRHDGGRTGWNIDLGLKLDF